MKTKNIALIGFMGTGKSAVGRALARALKRRFVETDALIKQQTHKTIPEIFKEKGETYFRRVERRVLQKAVHQSGTVISTGGGIVLNALNVRDLRRHCVVVCLTASLQTIRQRTAQNKNRPLLQNKNPFQILQNLLKSRRPLYRRAAHFFVRTTGKTSSQTTKTILRRLGRRP